MWKPSPWRRFPSKRGRAPYMRRLRSPSGAAVLRPQVVRTRFCGAKPCFGGIHFRQRMVDRGPHETGFMGQATLWKPSPWRRFPSKRGECPICAVSGRLPAQHGCARRSCVQGFCGAKPCFGGIHFRQRMVDRGPHETGFMGQAILWKPSPWRRFPSKRGSGPWREVFGKHRPFYGQFAGGRGKP